MFVPYGTLPANRHVTIELPKLKTIQERRESMCSPRMAEYTNANFFSEDTIFSGGFPYPAWSSVIENEEVIDATTGEKRTYLKKIGDGETINHLAASKWFYKYLPSPLKRLGLKLDNRVYADYSQKLVPRAVGYSVGLLDYFFRDNIEIILPEKGVYALTEDRNQGFTTITLLARNIAPGDGEMIDGSIELVVKHKLALEDPFQSIPVPTTEEFTYMVVPEANNARCIPRESPGDCQAGELVFNLNPAIPVNATDVYLQVIYKGRLGLEEGAVAVGFKDIGEPTPVDLFNDMDRICLNNNLNNNWYVAGSTEAIAVVDTDQNGVADPDEWDVYSHDLRNIYLRFSSPNDPKYASSTDYNLYIQELTAGSFLRKAYVLSDYQFDLGDRAYVILKRDPRDQFPEGYFPPRIYSYQSIKNQLELATPDQCSAYGLPWPCYIRYYPTFNSYRDQLMWGGIIYENAPYPLSSSCP